MRNLFQFMGIMRGKYKFHFVPYIIKTPGSLQLIISEIPGEKLMK
jgi:hypothetical protein